MTVKILFGLFVLSSSVAISQVLQNETDIRKAHEMFQEYDKDWDNQPAPGMANVRFLFKKGKDVYQGQISDAGKLIMQVENGDLYEDYCSPNKNGRWILYDCKPGDYTLDIVGHEEFEGFLWRRSGITLKEGETPVIVIDLNN